MGNPTCSLESVASGLTELRYLKVASIVIPPSSFLHFRYLEEATYCTSEEDAKALGLLIRKKDILPALQKLTCHRDLDNQWRPQALPDSHELFLGAMEGLEEACNAL